MATAVAAKACLAQVIDLTDVCRVSHVSVNRSAQHGSVRTTFHSYPTTTTAAASASTQIMTDSLHGALNEPFAAILEEVNGMVDELSWPALATSAATTIGHHQRHHFRDDIYLDPMDSIVVSVLRWPLQERRMRTERSALLMGAFGGGGSIATTTTTSKNAQTALLFSDPMVEALHMDALAAIFAMQQSYEEGVNGPQHSSLSQAQRQALFAASSEGDNGYYRSSSSLGVLTDKDRQIQSQAKDCTPVQHNGLLTTEQYLAMMTDYIAMLDVMPTASAGEDSSSSSTSTNCDNDNMSREERRSVAENRMTILALLLRDARTKPVPGAAKLSGPPSRFVDLRAKSFVDMSPSVLDELSFVVDGNTAAYTAAVTGNKEASLKRSTETEWTMCVSATRLSNAMSVYSSLFASIDPQRLSLDASTDTVGAPVMTTMLGLPCFDTRYFLDSETYALLRQQLIDACQQMGRDRVGDAPIAMLRRAASTGQQPLDIYTDEERWHDQWRLVLWRFARLIVMTPLRHDGLMEVATAPAEDMVISAQKSYELFALRHCFERWTTLLINMLDSYMRQAYDSIVRNVCPRAPVYTHRTVEAVLAATGNMEAAGAAEEHAVASSPERTALPAPHRRRRQQDGDDDDEKDDVTPASGTEHTDDNHSGAATATTARVDAGKRARLAAAHANYVERLRAIVIEAIDMRFEEPARLLDSIHAVVGMACSPEPFSFENTVSVNFAELTSNKANSARKSGGMEALFSNYRTEREFVNAKNRLREWSGACVLPVFSEGCDAPQWLTQTFGATYALAVRRLWRATNHMIAMQKNPRHAYAWALVYLLAHRSLLLKGDLWRKQFNAGVDDRMIHRAKEECLSFSRKAPEHVILETLQTLGALTTRLTRESEPIAATIPAPAPAPASPLSMSTVMPPPTSPLAMAASSLSSAVAAAASVRGRKRKASAVPTPSVAAEAAASSNVVDVDKPWTRFAEKPAQVAARLGQYSPTVMPHPALAKCKAVEGEDFCEWMLEVARAEWIYSAPDSLATSSKRNKPVGSPQMRFTASKAVEALVEWNNRYGYANPMLKPINDVYKTAFALRLLQELMPPDDYAAIAQRRANSHAVLAYRPESCMYRFMAQDSPVGSAVEVHRFANHRDASMYTQKPMVVRRLPTPTLPSQQQAEATSAAAAGTDADDSAAGSAPRVQRQRPNNSEEPTLPMDGPLQSGYFFAVAAAADSAATTTTTTMMLDT